LKGKSKLREFPEAVITHNTLREHVGEVQKDVYSNYCQDNTHQEYLSLDWCKKKWVATLLSGFSNCKPDLSHKERRSNGIGTKKGRQEWQRTRRLMTARQF